MTEPASRCALRVAFAGGNGYPPEACGGVQSSTHDLAMRLRSAGHHPTVFAPLYGDGWFGLSARMRLKLSGTDLVCDSRSGYPVYRAWFPERSAASFIRVVRPDVAVVQCHGTVPIVRAFQRAGIPVVVYLRNVEFHEMEGDPSELRGASFIANSRFTAEVYRDRFGFDATVIPPTLDRSFYETQTSREYVTFINPVPEKGLDLALRIAGACPEIPFLFVESWLLEPKALESLQAALRAYPNIRFERRRPDVRSVYRRSRILLAPSKWQEAWGRIASEAHCSAIPVVGSNRGGLPESIGPGGIVLPHEAPLDDWVAAIRALWSDPDRYREASEAARVFSLRPEMQADRQFQVFSSILHHAIPSGATAPQSDSRHETPSSQRVVGVVIPYYQKEPGILRRALEGIAAQELPSDIAIRVYIIDDESPHPPEVEYSAFEEILDIAVARQPNGGPGKARNRGLELIAGAGDVDFVAFLDSDDIWKPCHLTDAIAALDVGYDFYSCDNVRPGTYDLFSEHMELLGDGGRKLASRSTLVDPDGPVRGFEPHTLSDDFAVNYLSHTSSVVVRAGKVRCRRFDPDLRNAGEDRMFWLTLALDGARVALSWRTNVECGRGVNLFFSAYSWDSPATVERFGCELLFAEKLRRHEDQSPIRLEFARARAARSRRAYAFLFVRMLLRFRRPPTGTFRQLIRFDPALPLRMPILFLKVFFDPSPTRQI